MVITVVVTNFGPLWNGGIRDAVNFLWSSLWLLLKDFEIGLRTPTAHANAEVHTNAHTNAHTHTHTHTHSLSIKYYGRHKTHL